MSLAARLCRLTLRNVHAVSVCWHWLAPKQAIQYCLQALTVLEFLIKRGSNQCVENAQNLKVRLEDLQVFEYTSPDGRDHGVNVRHRYMPTPASLTCHIALELLINAHAGSMSLALASTMGISVFQHNICSTFKQLMNTHQLDTLYTALLKQACDWPSEKALQSLDKPPV